MLLKFEKNSCENNLKYLISQTLTSNNYLLLYDKYICIFYLTHQKKIGCTYIECTKKKYLRY